MRIVLDTHALVWWFNDPDKLSRRALAILSNPNNTVLVSAAVAWELAIKTNLGRFQTPAFVSELAVHVAEEGFVELPISIEQATRAGFLPLHHRDPFDRLLVAQAQALNVPILSSDAALERYDVRRIW